MLVPLCEAQGVESMLFTRRTEQVEYHKGQISFPGGASEDGEEQDPVGTALREAREEIGVVPDAVEVLGLMEPLAVVHSGFIVTPVVGWIRTSPYPFRPSPAEVAEILTVPLAWLCEPGSVQTRSLRRGDSVYEDAFFTYGGHTVWGATGRIVKRLIDLVTGA